jgi:hypothetical protein
MLQLFTTWLNICLLRTAPQDLPASGFLLGLTLSCYIGVSFLLSLHSYGFLPALLVALLDTGLLVVFVLGLLYLQARTARVNQTLSALAGSGTVLGLFSLPLVLFLEPGQTAEQLPLLVPVFWLCLFFWSLAVVAHIMRHALSTSFAMGIAISVLYALVSMQILATVFPLQD